jgi:hypothetical protein
VTLIKVQEGERLVGVAPILDAVVDELDSVLADEAGVIDESADTSVDESNQNAEGDTEE